MKNTFRLQAEVGAAARASGHPVLDAGRASQLDRHSAARRFFSGSASSLRTWPPGSSALGAHARFNSQVLHHPGERVSAYRGAPRSPG